MRLNARPENLFERIALRAGVVPTPLGDTIVAMTLARTIMVATKLGVFEALAKAEGTAHDIAIRCGLDRRATEVLLFALAGAGYVRSKGMCYALAPVAQKWLLKSSPRSLYDYMLFNFLNWSWDERFEDFLRTGEPAHIHQEMSHDEWQMYQRAMRSLAGFSAFEVARRIPVPRGALDMLDIGGSHGYYSVMLCRLHLGLRSVVFDLPEAVVHASQMLAQEGMGERIVHRAGNALTDDLGNEEYDLIFIGNLLHHFNERVNRDLVKRSARALRPGGYLVIEELQRVQSPKEVGELGALSNLYFAVTSEAGTWSMQEIADWQREANLIPRKQIQLFTAPGAGIQAALKPTSNGKTSVVERHRQAVPRAQRK
jgi:2-polyprenyl-3-methyl-5-hydroxy-6-metoxy-1,4-benzoquinol methylase